MWRRWGETSLLLMTERRFQRGVCQSLFSGDKWEGNSLDWLLGRISSVKERSDIEMGFPEKQCSSYGSSFLNFPGLHFFPYTIAWTWKKRLHPMCEDLLLVCLYWGRFWCSAQPAVLRFSGCAFSSHLLWEFWPQTPLSFHPLQKIYRLTLLFLQETFLSFSGVLIFCKKDW